MCAQSVATPAQQAGKLDPFTAEIIRNALVAIGEEMFVSLGRTSKSPIIYEVLDYCCGLTDARAQLIAQGNGVALFLGTLTFAVQAVLDKFGVAGLQEGDIIMTNDPYAGGGTHLSDVSMIMPIFFEGQLLAFAANKAHWTEVGGKDPGSWTTDATEVFQEGLQFPNVKLFEGGRANQSLIDMVEANVRLPDMTLGDLYAQAASVRLGARRVVELCQKYGRATVEAAIEWLLAYGEEIVRAEMARLPKGVFAAEDWIDDDGLSAEPIPVKVQVTITEEEFTCDFTGTGPQGKGPVNSSLTNLRSMCRAIFRAVTDPHMSPNEGCFRPLKVICPPRTIVSAERPAPVSCHWDPKNHGCDVVWKALAPHMPDRLSAGHFLSVCALILETRHPDSGERTLLVEPTAGGWGACADHDGADGLVCVGDGETYILPVEVTETVYGILVDQYGYHIAKAGEGRFRGGRGLVRDYRIVGEQDAVLSTMFTRHRTPPWGVNGGRAGSTNTVEIHRREDVVSQRAGKISRVLLRPGDIARLITGTGGGWGDPRDRDPAAVARDVQAGFVSPQVAREVYGWSGEG